MNAPVLTVSDFDAFFEAAYPGKTAFPWQRRLAAQVCTTGEWPHTLDLPTGTGKTAVLDIAVFAMALDAVHRPDRRRAPRRALLVVDRRTVVDQAYLRAKGLADRLSSAAAETILGRVASALASLRGKVSWAPQDGARPLEVAHLRGAVPRDDGWARDPSQPMLGVSTVDQVGSRLLFRGYGVSAGMRSVHAGLLGNDILYFLDEVHLSRPFAETLGAVSYWRDRAETSPQAALQVVTMSATHRSSQERSPFGLDDSDHQDTTLRRRLDAKKPVTLEVIKVSGDEDRRRTTFAQKLAELALGAVTPRHRRIAIVVNRVNTALAVHDAAVNKAGGNGTVLLVTGRMRPIDREDREHELQSVQAGMRRDDEIRIVVATQCIEAGADLDFDVLITECASLDALVQRFGRLDRLGDLGEGLGVIAIRSDHTNEEDVDPVYGEARVATWRWLTERPTALDFGLQGGVRVDAPPSLLPPERHAPVLLPGHLDLWSQTRPAPFPDPDVALWLHGLEHGSAEVNIVWRADLTVSDDSLERLDDETLEELLEVSPPLRQEALAVPLWAAERWLRGAEVDGLADVEGGGHTDNDDRDDGRAGPRWAILWRGGDDGIQVLNDRGRTNQPEMRPGDTLIVPSNYGGIRAGTWAADSREPVTDRGDEAQLRQRHRLAVRLDAIVMAPCTEASPEEAWRTRLRQLADTLIKADEDSADGIRDAIEKIRAQLLAAPPSFRWLAKVLDGVRLEPRFISLWSSDRPGPRQRVLLTARKNVKPAPRHDDTNRNASDNVDDDMLPMVSSEDDSASRTGVAVFLADHLAHVAEHAAAFARTQGLPVGLANDVALAAAWHDAGKADPRFQLWLVGGDEVSRAALQAPLAKSSLKDNDRRRQLDARRRARYPVGARHELASVAMLERSEAVLERATDPDLVLHLVASHHGWCRPFAPVEAEGKAVAIEWEHGGVVLAASSDHGLAHAGASVVDRFWKLTQKYGWWGLAWLETLVRLADHRASEAEQQAKEEGATR